MPFAPAESGPKVLSHAAAYEKSIQEKDQKQAVIRGSKGAAASPAGSPTKNKNFVVAKKRQAWLKDKTAVWFGALSLAVALLELTTAFRLLSAPDAASAPSRLPSGPLSAARALGLGAAPAPKKPMEPAARLATLLGRHGARAGLTRCENVVGVVHASISPRALSLSRARTSCSAALVLVVAASADGPTRLRAALTVAFVELASAYSAPESLVRTMEAQKEAGAGAADQCRLLECTLPILWLLVACFEWRELQQPKQAALPAGATANVARGKVTVAK